jgi:CBS domain-containing protein
MLTVGDVMTRSVVSAQPATPLREVAELLVENHGISGLPVVDADGTVLGVVSEADLLIKAQGAGAIHHRPLARILGESARTREELAKLEAATAGEAMTAPAVTISSRRPVHEAAGVMVKRGVNRLPVVDDGRLVGIITRADLVRSYVRSDAELAATIRSEVIRRILWLDPGAFKVVVQDGVATIDGHVERRSTADMLGRAVRMVPGIVQVHATVTWAMDDGALQPSSQDPVFPFGSQ